MVPCLSGSKICLLGPHTLRWVFPVLSYFVFMTCLLSIVYIAPTETFLKTNVIKILCLKNPSISPIPFRLKCEQPRPAHRLFLLRPLLFAPASVQTCCIPPNTCTYLTLPDISLNVDPQIQNTHHLLLPVPIHPFQAPHGARLTPHPLQDHLRSHLLD